MEFLNRFKHWHNNRTRGGSTHFFATYEQGFDLNLLKPALFTIIEEVGTLGEYKYCLGENEYFQVTKDFILQTDFNSQIKSAFSIDSDSSVISSIHVQKDIAYKNRGGFISFGIEQAFFINGFIELLFPGFLYLASYSETDYKIWQNKYGLNAYRYRGGIKIVKGKDGKKIVDIKSRPGRSVRNKYFVYESGSKLWFGEKIFPYIPKARLLSFKHKNVEVKEIKENLIEVCLYKNVYDGDAPESQEAQQLFREHIGIDDLNIGN